ncbi:MAG: hypothetical protein SFV81_08785 [Pirellulaceae bacterium]|nr:hypothetical protein [Pirellulaceae bacterium]
MTLGGIVILLLLVASLIIFIYLIVISARGWGALHTVMLCFLFIECWVFMIFSAGVLHRRVGWLKQAHNFENKTIKSEADVERLTWGGENIAPDEPDSIVLAKAALRRLTADRGRVWRRLELSSSDGGVFKLEMKAPAPAQDLSADPAAPPAAAPAIDTATSLPANLVVHCFAEEGNEQNQALPVFYLGEFKVATSQAGQVTLSPTLPLEPNQLDMIKSGGAPTWALYELLPLDSHTAFAAPGSKPDEEMIFGRMDEEKINALLQRIPEERREKVLKDYLRDGQKANTDGSDPVASRWVNVELLKDLSIDVDGTDAIATELGFFDSQGRSVDPRLKRKDAEGDLKLAAGTTKPIVLKSEYADKLIASGVAKQKQPYFVRPLIDYQEAFNSTYVRRHEVNERIAHFKREALELAKANTAGQEMISFRQIENQQLNSDLVNFKKEGAIVKEEADLAEQELAALKAKITEMYRQVQSRAGIVSQ